MTPEQLVALKNDIAADQELSQLTHTADHAFAIAAAYNLPFDPAFYVWKTDLSVTDIMANGFDWARVDNLSVGKARIWEWMSQLGSINPSRANVRAGIIAAWVGTAADLAVRLAIFGHCQRLATRCEKLFATGAGTAVVVDGTGPATCAFAGELVYQDILSAWNS